MDATEAGLLQVAAKRKPGRPAKHVQPGPELEPAQRVYRTQLEGDEQVQMRAERVPFGGFSLKLEVKNKDPNFYYYWFKDEGDMLTRAEEAGYEYVSPRQAGMRERLTNRDVHGGNQSIVDRIERTGGRDEFGRHYNLVLMRQPMEYHLLDKAAADKVTDEVDNAINRQTFSGSNVAQKYGDVQMNRAKE